MPPGVDVVRYADLPGIPCPCGSAKRGFMESPGIPFSLHITSISETARKHYHKRLTETYLVLECDRDAYLELNDQRLPLEPEMAVLIPPGTRHRAVGKMKVAIVAWPKFDPNDEWFDN
ncbi:MAG: cupin domain-containing protein [Pirellulaceae bacterium]|nr:cupin domain-containing protein [Pirellulaceae bacterium]